MTEAHSEGMRRYWEKRHAEKPKAATPTATPDELLAYYKARLEHKFSFWKPYPKQHAFLAMQKRERLLRGGNKVGKTYTGAGEVVAHATGRYPAWWRGVRYDRPTLIWAAGFTGIATRDGPQTLLLGLPGDKSQQGTGMIPKDLIVGDPPTSRSAPNGIDSVIVRHATGGSSKIVFKTYEQGAGSWQGPYVDVIWLDEESPSDIYQEALARLTGQGRIFTTFTPMLGYSQLVSRFLRDNSFEAERDRGQVQLTLADAEHFTEEEKEQRRAGYLPHERLAREMGEPMMGEGSVFTVPEQDLRVNMSLGAVPAEWRKLWGIDFGGSSISKHAFGAVLFAFDLENDMDYILTSIKMTTPPGVPSILTHCDAMKRICAGALVAWPADGHVTRDGEAMADIYKGHGLLMLPEHAQFASGGYNTQPGIDLLDQRMHQRKLLIRNCPENEKWFEEYRAYHYKDDKVVREFDDLMSATRTGFIYKRKAHPAPLGPGGEAPRRRYAPVTDFDLFSGDPILVEV